MGFKGYMVQIGASYYGGIQGQGFDPGVAVMPVGGDGQIDARFASIVAQRSTASFSTFALKTVLSAIGWNGLLSSFTQFDLKEANGASLETTGHAKIGANTAYIYPVSLSCNVTGNAVATFQVMAYNSDGNDPIVETFSQALPGGVINGNEVFGLGPVSVNGKVDSGLESVNISFGLNGMFQPYPGKIHPKGVHVRRRQAVIRCTTVDADFNQSLYSAISSSTSVAFRRRLHGAAFYPDGSAEHIKCTMTKGVVQKLGASGESEKKYQYQILPVFDGSNASVQIGAGVGL